MTSTVVGIRPDSAWPAEAPLSWRSSIAAASGVAGIALILGGDWDAVSLRAVAPTDSARNT